MTRNIRRHTVVVFALAVATFLTAACGKKAGSSCKGSESTCKDKKTALACRGGTFAEVACAGPLGCSKYQDHANCDTSLALAGQPCLGEDDEYACSPDRKHAAICKAGKFVPWLECRGKAGCSVTGRSVACDTSVAETGDTCKKEGAVACTGDKKQMLQCRNGKFTLRRYCRGEAGCSSDGEAPSCDDRLGLAGDPCDVPGQVVCALDRKSELVCQGSVYAKGLSCKTDCTVTDRPGRPIECR